LNAIFNAKHRQKSAKKKLLNGLLAMIRFIFMFYFELLRGGMVLFHCLRCGVCCTRYWIPLSHLDLFRLEFYGDVDVYFAVVLRNIFIYRSSKHYPVIDFKDRKYYLSLRNFHGRCIFLSDSGECLVHGFKPLACRFYPFKYTVMNNDIYIELQENAIRECPGLILDGKPINILTKKQLLSLARQRIMELKLYNEAVLEWNEEFSNKHTSLNKLIEFLLEKAEKHFKILNRKGLWIK